MGAIVNLVSKLSFFQGARSVTIWRFGHSDKGNEKLA